MHYIFTIFLRILEIFICWMMLLHVLVCERSDLISVTAWKWSDLWEHWVRQGDMRRGTKLLFSDSPAPHSSHSAGHGLTSATALSVSVGDVFVPLGFGGQEILIRTELLAPAEGLRSVHVFLLYRRWIADAQITVLEKTKDLAADTDEDDPKTTGCFP